MVHLPEKRFVFKPDKWDCANTYNNNYKSVSDAKFPGVYLLVYCDLNTDLSKYKKYKHKIFYVGSSKNLSKRLTASHPTLIFLQKKYDYIQIYFKEVVNDHFGIEKSLIKLIQPKYNKQLR